MQHIQLTQKQMEFIGKSFQKKPGWRIAHSSPNVQILQSLAHRIKVAVNTKEGTVTITTWTRKERNGME